jgi:hypothetical protein
MQGYYQTLPFRISEDVVHVTSSRDRREAIFEDDDDRVRFLEILGSVMSSLIVGHFIIDIFIQIHWVTLPALTSDDIALMIDG